MGRSHSKTNDNSSSNSKNSGWTFSSEFFFRERPCLCVPKPFTTNISWWNYFRKECQAMGKKYDWMGRLQLVYQNNNKPNDNMLLDLFKTRLENLIDDEADFHSNRGSMESNSSFNFTLPKKKRLVGSKKRNFSIFEENKLAKGIQCDNNNKNIFQKISSDLLLELKDPNHNDLLSDTVSTPQKISLSDKIAPKKIYQISSKKGDLTLDIDGYLHVSSCKEPENSEDFLKIEVERALNNFRLITNAMDDVISDPRSSLHSIRKKFVHGFVKAYEPLIISKRNMKINSKNFKEKAEICISDLKDFINLFQETLSIYFNLHEVFQEKNKIFTMLTKENLIAFSSGQLFTDEIYYVIHEIYRFLNSAQEERLATGLSVGSKFSLNEFGLPLELTPVKRKQTNQTLSEAFESLKTPNRSSLPTSVSRDRDKSEILELIDSFKTKDESIFKSSPILSKKDMNFVSDIAATDPKRKKTQKKSIDTTEGHNCDMKRDYLDDISEMTTSYVERDRGNMNNKLDQNGESFYSLPYKSEISIAADTRFDSCYGGDGFSQISLNKHQFSGNLKSKLSGEEFPFQRAINNLKSIQFFRSPLQKLRTLVSTAELIVQCANEYYTSKFDDEREISAGEFVRLFLYVIAHSKFKSLVIHLSIMEDFSTRSLAMSSAGHYLVILNTCIYLLGELEEGAKEDGPGFSEVLDRCFNSLLTKSRKTENR